MSTLTLYRYKLSGHSHRVELFLSVLGLTVNIVEVDLPNGEHKKPDFLAKNIFAQVPVLQDGNLILADSNAILVYLAKTYDEARTWLPVMPAEASAVQRFLSTAAGELAHGLAAARRSMVFGAKLDQAVIAASHELLKIYDAHLADRNWLATDLPTIADISNYTYIAHAPEGGVALDKYHNLGSWLQRIKSLSGFVPMQASKTVATNNK